MPTTGDRRLVIMQKPSCIMHHASCIMHHASCIMHYGEAIVQVLELSCVNEHLRFALTMRTHRQA